MSHYEERLERDLDAIRSRLRELGINLDRAIANSVSSLVGFDRAKAADVILGDLPINRAVRALDRRCHAFVARHLPSAGHLRFVSSVLRLNVALERIGDYAVTIAREVSQMSSAPPKNLARDVEMLSDQSRRMLAQAIESFIAGNADLARGTKGMATNIDTGYGKVFEELITEGRGSELTLRELFGVLATFNRLERISDQAKNICEDTIFAVDGETKPPKVYKILFLERCGDVLGPMAVAYARKSFPESGVYVTRAWEPADSVQASVAELLDSRGLEVQADPRGFDLTPHELETMHVIVSLDGPTRDRLGRVPFHTALLEWNIELPSLDPESLEPAFDELRNKVGDLIELLRGEDEAH